MKYRKGLALYGIGGAGYVALEFLWRGWSHWSMFLAGGTCFLLLGRLDRLRLKLPLRSLAGAGIITGVELVTGLLVNRDFRVWDYRDQPMNFRGQICLPYALLWLPLSLVAMGIYRAADKMICKGGTAALA